MPKLSPEFAGLPGFLQNRPRYPLIIDRAASAPRPPGLSFPRPAPIRASEVRAAASRPAETRAPARPRSPSAPAPSPERVESPGTVVQLADGFAAIPCHRPRVFTPGQPLADRLRRFSGEQRALSSFLAAVGASPDWAGLPAWLHWSLESGVTLNARGVAAISGPTGPTGQRTRAWGLGQVLDTTSPTLYAHMRDVGISNFPGAVAPAGPEAADVRGLDASRWLLGDSGRAYAHAFIHRVDAAYRTVTHPNAASARSQGVRDAASALDNLTRIFRLTEPERKSIFLRAWGRASSYSGSAQRLRSPSWVNPRIGCIRLAERSFPGASR